MKRFTSHESLITTYDSRKYDIVFAVIAMREVVFFANIASLLREDGYNIAFLTFYEPGDAYLQARGFKVFSLHKETAKGIRDLSEDSIRDYEKKYGIENLRHLLIHEKLTFNRYDETKLLSKALNYLDYFEKIIQDNEIRIFMQELGGFIAPLTLFYAAQAHNVKHIFFEPAMYKGRIFFNLNTLDVDLFADSAPKEGTAQFVKDYIEKYYSEKTVVVPDKDKHLFMDMSLRKLVNKRNLEKLWYKVYNKYIKREEEEYNAILNHIQRALRTYFNRKSIGKYYKPFYSEEKYVYFPFHVPLDIQLTVRSREYLDQLFVVSLIADFLPVGYKLYIKEHPVGTGAYSAQQIKQLLKNENVVFLNPHTNSADIIKNADFIITINSKVGAEALMQNKKVIVLGTPYYKGFGVTADIAGLLQLKKVLVNLYKYAKEDISEEKLNSFFYKVYQSCFQGELYLNTEKNIDDFKESIKKYIEVRKL